LLVFHELEGQLRLDIEGRLTNTAGTAEADACPCHLPDYRKDWDTQPTCGRQKVEKVDLRLIFELFNQVLVRTKAVQEKATLGLWIIGLRDLNAARHNADTHDQILGSLPQELKWNLRS